MLDKITKKIEDAMEQLPVAHDIKLQMETTMRRLLDEMNVVMREELDVQQARLTQAQARLDELEARVVELEERHLKG